MPLKIHYIVTEEITEDLLGSMQKAHEQIFDPAYSLNKIKSRLADKGQGILSMALDDDQNCLGFKLGYRWDDDSFYSWVGGVIPEARRQGIAKKLLDDLESFLKNNTTYKKLRTHSRNQFPEMIYLNLKSGFSITDTIPTDNPLDPKIVFIKKLMGL